VCDLQHHPVAGADVSLQTTAGAQIRRTQTDSKGVYKFSALAEGTYTVRAETAERGKASSPAVPLHAKETKTIDLTLSASSLSFFDEPTFSVAGVTDTTNLGGHGSDTVVRTKDALAKATVSLSKGVGAEEAANSRTEESWRASLQNDPGNFVANVRLGKLLVESGRTGDAKAYLARASEVEAGNDSISPRDRADLHHLLGDIAEQAGDPLAAVREYQRATELDASETNIFDWGAELLLHHAPEPATEVFGNGNRLFPRSIRMLLGLGVTWYVRGSYEQATQRLCEAADLEPNDPGPYLFLGKIQSAESSVPRAIAERLQRFATLAPQNAMANYYYAVSLWKQRQGPDDVGTSAKVQSLLEKAVALDPKLSEAFLQSGIVYAERRDFQKAIAAYRRAIQLDAHLEQAHYRLAQAYRNSGQNDLAKSEIEVYEKICKEKTAAHERARTEIKQFVYTLKGRNP
jgi:tetratricopeptide (TPR) repeat protein